MGPYFEFRLPDVGEGVAEAEITVWHVRAGDRIQEDQSLVDVMTDKATVDMTSPVDGIVRAVHGEVGAMVPVGAVLVEIEVEGAAGEVVPATSAEVVVPAAGTSSELSAKLPGDWPAGEAFTPRRASEPNAPLAAPSTRRRAKQAGVALWDVPTTGPAGRVTAKDLDAFLERLDAKTSLPARSDLAGEREGVTDTRIIGLRRKIAEKMQDAKRRIPHIAYVEEIDMTSVEALRQVLNDDRRTERPKLTLLPFFIHALIRVLPDFPQINARYDDDAGVLHAHDAVHVGIATQTPGGLMVPVVRHAEALDLWRIASEIARLGRAARDGTARRDELSGSTITITSLGPLGGIATTPVINHPEVAIIAPNKIVERPVVEGSFVSVRKIMNLSCSFDHRIVDGYDAASFVQRMKRMLEHPALIFMQGEQLRHSAP